MGDMAENDKSKEFTFERKEYLKNIYLPLHIVTWDGRTKKPHVASGRRSDGA